MGNSYGGDGLATVVLDLNRIQKMLFKVPSGTAYGRYPWAHRLFSYLMCDANSIITTDLVLQQIKKCAKEVIPSNDGAKNFNVYYTGHGDK